VVEGTGLENRHTGEPGIESSNLSLSVPLLRARSCALAVLSALKRCWDGWPSGLRRTPGKCVYVYSVPWVRIPPRPCSFPKLSHPSGKTLTPELITLR
jgi:hypothetical protein